MLQEYHGANIDLGSIQYLGVAQRYTELKNKERKPYTEIKNIILEPTQFKKQMKQFLTEVQEDFNQIIKEGLYQPEKNEYLYDRVGVWDEYTYNELFDFLTEQDTGSPFNFPVKISEAGGDNLIRLALFRWFEYVRNSSWDLWSAVGSLTQHFDNLGEYDYFENESIAQFLYLLSEVYSFNDEEIQTLAGDFDT